MSKLAGIFVLGACLVAPLVLYGQQAKPQEVSAEAERKPKFSSIEYYRNIYRNSKATLQLPEDKRKLRAWRSKVASRLHDVLGLAQSKPVPLNPRVTPLGQRKGYRIERIVFSSEEYADVPGLLLIPDGVSASNPAPAVLCLHGNTPGAKDELAGETAGNPEAAEGLALYKDDYARELAQRGFITFAIDLRDSGERQHWEQYKGATFSPPEGRNKQWYWREVSGAMAIPLGRSYLGLCLFDAMRALDYLETRPEVKKGAIGCVGFSAGATLTTLLTTLDRRVKVAGASGSATPSRVSMAPGAHTRQASWTIPGIYTDLDWDLCVAAGVPTPMMLVREYRNNLERATANTLKIRQAYERFGVPGNLKIAYAPGPHVWHGELVIPWFEKQMRLVK